MTLTDYRRWTSVLNETVPDLSVVIPTYNEEWRILPTIGAIATHVSSMGLTWELVIADDGSTDKTISLIEALDMVNLHLLVAEKNGGKGSAVRRGVQAATGRYVLFADADQSTPIEQLDDLLGRLRRREADIAIGSRAAAGAQVHSKGLTRRIASRGLQSVVRLLYPIRIEDTQCGFKLFTAESATTLFNLQLVDGFSFDLEVLYLAHRLGFEVVEVPVEWIDAPGSTVDAGKVAVRFLVDLLVVRANEAVGRYRRGDNQSIRHDETTRTPLGEATWISTAKESPPASSPSRDDSMPTRPVASAPISMD